jgi:hypothetical protein
MYGDRMEGGGVEIDAGVSEKSQSIIFVFDSVTIDPILGNMYVYISISISIYKYVCIYIYIYMYIYVYFDPSVGEMPAISSSRELCVALSAISSSRELCVPLSMAELTAELNSSSSSHSKLSHKCFELLCSLLMPYGWVYVFHVGHIDKIMKHFSM